MVKYCVLTFYFVFLSIYSSAQSNQAIYSKCIPQLDTLDGLEVFIITEKPPEYQGGMSAFYKEISKNLVIPRETRRMGIESKFLFTFVIDTLGNMRNLCFIKPENSYLEDRIIQAINREKKWVPAEHKNQKVPYRFMIPIHIHLD